MDNIKKMFTGILILSVFVFVISVISLYVEMNIESGDLCGCIIPLPFFIPFVGSMGLFIGTLLYYLLSPRFDNRRRVDMKVVMRILNSSEALIIQKLIENNGELPQSRLSSLSGLSKVKTFRVIESLIKKGVITKQPLGKTRLIRLEKDIMEIFL